MLAYLGEEWGNPSSSYRFGSHWQSKIEKAREQVADLLEAKAAREVIFTSGGTENVSHLLSLGTSAASAQKKQPAYDATVSPLRDAMEEGILTTIPNTERNGHTSQRLGNTTNLTFHGIESEALLLLLDQAGICASSGSACLADSPDPSHVIAAMKPGAAAQQSVRFSLGFSLRPPRHHHRPWQSPAYRQYPAAIRDFRMTAFLSEPHREHAARMPI